MKKYLTLVSALLAFAYARCQTFEFIDTNFADNTGVFVSFNDKIYYCGSDSVHGAELWVTDGTVAGTHLLKDINTTGNSYPNSEFIYQGKLYFQAQDSTGMNGLWVTDGTAGGTQLVSYTGVHGMMEFNGKMYFAGTGGLWVSDGTYARTYLVSPVQITESPSYFGVQTIVGYNGKLYFCGTDSAHGAELWVSDGTDSGTYMLYDILAGTGSSSPFNLTAFNNKLFFGAYTGTAYNAEPTLFTYDGHSLVNLPDVAVTNCDTFFVFNNQLYILALDGPYPGNQNLWVTDGTEAGTVKVSNTNPQSGNGSTTRMARLGNKIFFCSNDSLGNFVPWISDGTIGGTQCLNDTIGDCMGTWPMAYNNRVYFASLGGFVLTSTDGTPQGTQFLYLNDTLFNLYTTTHFAQTSNGLFFNAAHRTGTSFNDLWKLTTTAPTAINNQQATLPGINVFPNPCTGSFQLQLANTPGGPLQVSVYDLTGRLLMQQNVVNNGAYTTTINLANAASGVYLLQVKNHAGTQSQKIEVY